MYMRTGSVVRPMSLSTAARAAAAFFRCGFVGIRLASNRASASAVSNTLIPMSLIMRMMSSTLRIGNILRQVVVDLRVSQVSLLTASGDQLFQTRLLLRFSGHNIPSTEGLGGQKKK